MGRIDPLLAEIFGQEAIDRLLAEEIAFDVRVLLPGATTPTGYACGTGYCVAARLLQLGTGDIDESRLPRFPSADVVLSLCPGMTPDRWDDYTWKDRCRDRLDTLIFMNDDGQLATAEGVRLALEEGARSHDAE